MMLIALKSIILILYSCKGSKRTFEDVLNDKNNIIIDLNIPETRHFKAGCFTCDYVENCTSSLCKGKRVQIGKNEIDFYTNDVILPSTTEYHELTDTPEIMKDKCSLETSNIYDFEKISTFDQCSISIEQLDNLVMEKLEGDNCNMRKLNVNDTKKANDVLTNSDGVNIECLTRMAKKDDMHFDSEENKSDLQMSRKEDLKVFKSITSEFKIYIDQLILYTIPESHIKNYRRNIENIEKASVIFDKYEIDFRNNQTIFQFLHDEEFLKEFKLINMMFDKDTNFDRESYDKFLFEFNFKIFYTSYTVHVCDELQNLSNDEKLIVFYFEFIKLYRYIDDIPELLSLSSLIEEKSMHQIIFIMHLINLFIENIQNIEDNNVFILLMVAKAFDCFYGLNFDIFLIPNYELICDKYHHNLTFFLWGYERFRYNVTRRINRSEGTVNDLKFLKIIVLTFLYQHLIFIKHYSDCPVQLCWSQKTFIGLGVSPLFFIYMKFLTC